MFFDTKKCDAPMGGIQEGIECSNVDKLSCSMKSKEKSLDFNCITPDPATPIKFNYFNKDEKKHEITADDVYEDNSGTVLLLIVDKKLVIASDTRHSSDFGINSRNMTRIFKIGNFFLCSAGFYADVFEIYKILLRYHKEYECDKPMPISALAHVMCNVLYSRRFFPYRVNPSLAGFENGKPIIYSFDCVGSYQAVQCRCEGSGVGMIQPLLDSWVMGKNFQEFRPLNLEESLKIVRASFHAASEIDIKTKDFLEIIVVDEHGVESMREELRRD